MAVQQTIKEPFSAKEGVTFLEQLAGNYTRFLLNGEEFAIKTEFVVSIQEKPAIRMVPKAPEFIEGIANIEGKIVPILNPFVRFDMQKQAANVDLFLLLIKLEGITYGVLTEEITGTNYLSAAMLEMVNPLIKKKESPFIAAMAKLQEKLIYLLDLQGFIFAGFEVERKETKAYKEFVSSRNLDIAKKKENFTRYLLMQIADQEYCLEINRLETVISTKSIRQNEGINPLLYGVIEHNNSIIPILDLQKKFGLTKQDYTEDSRIVMVKTNNYTVGFMVNEVKEIINIYPEEVKAAPEIFENDSYIKGIGMLNKAERLVVLLNEDKIVNKDEMTEFDKLVAQNKLSETKKTAVKEVTQPMLIFKVNTIEFALPLEKVREVINMQAIKVIPKAPPHIKGVFSYRGDLATAIDLGKRLDLIGTAVEKYLIVVEHEQVTIGIATEKIEEILEVGKSSLKAPSKNIKGVDTKYISQLISVPNTKRTAIVLNVEKIINK